MVEGKDVQIATYLLAAQNILPQGRNVGAAYYLISDRSRKGIFHENYYRALGVTKGKNVLNEQEFAAQNHKFAEILQGYIRSILEGRFPIEPASPRICSFCAFQGICRKEAGF
jgi:ATP-dependent helicase/DNAse subunit B